jgi:hypothetical protein
VPNDGLPVPLGNLPIITRPYGSSATLSRMRLPHVPATDGELPSRNELLKEAPSFVKKLRGIYSH